MGLRAWFKRGHHKMEPGTPLDDFVSSALAGISRGIRRANEDLRASGTITGNNFFLEPSGGAERLMWSEQAEALRSLRRPFLVSSSWCTLRTGSVRGRVLKSARIERPA